MQQNLVVHTLQNVQSFILEAVEDHFILKKNLPKLKVDKKDCEMSCVIQCHATPSKPIEMLRRLWFFVLKFTQILILQFALFSV